MGGRFFRMVFLFGLFVFMLFFLAFVVKNAGDVLSGTSKSEITGKIVQKRVVEENSNIREAGNVLSGFATHPVYSGFSLPESRFTYSNSTGLISVIDSIIYKYAYYSINGGPWQTTPLTGTYYGVGSDWLENTATGTVPAMGAGEHYIITYSCIYLVAENAWDCHGNKWQIITINNTQTSHLMIIFESPTPSDGATVNTNTQTITAVTSQSTGEDTSTWMDFDKSLIGYWSMDNYSTNGVYDGSTYQNFAKFEQGLNIADISTGIRGRGIKFVSNLMSCEDGSWLSVDSLKGTTSFSSAGQLTYAAWIKPDSINWAGIMGTENVKLHITSEGRIKATLYNPGIIQYDSNRAVLKDQWQQIALTYTKSTGNITIYHNGNIIGTTSVQTRTSQTIRDTSL